MVTFIYPILSLPSIMKRTHTCGELTKKSDKKEVVLQGWVQTRRDHGGVIFIDLRDRYGVTQVVFNPDKKELFKTADSLRREWVVEVHGKVRQRPEGMQNKNLPTGTIEVVADKLDVLNQAETPPIEIEDRIESSEDMRLKYRYLDLRRPVMQQRIIARHKAAKAVRDYFDSKGFLEIETPMLIRATPEGARDYIVPSRTCPGKFFSLPQSPQLYKQILMVSGMDRYFQLARCLRDEDLRADRQPEFTQIDIEMSFPEEEDIYSICEGMLKKVWKDVNGISIKTPFPRLTYKEAVARYGSDKPDLRYKLELTDVTEIVKKSDFEVFKKSPLVKCINPEKDFGRKDLDKYSGFCISCGAKGMAWTKVTKDGLEGSITKYIKPDLQKEIIKKTGAKAGSVIMFIADKPVIVNDVLDRLRRKLAEDLGLIKEGELNFCWITHFPLYEYNEDTDSWSPMHHIFSMPHDEFIGNLAKDPGKATGKLYDCVLNGVELGGGSIRIHKKEIQEEALKVIGMNYEQAEKRFGFLLNSFRYGAPPHGGLAFGFDRLCALLNGFNDIRDVIAFPKNKNAENPMDGCPSEVEPEQLKELFIKTELPKSSKKE
ncbi:aspartate--tRNA ligase [Candidatus Woesearchaeota archaeon]|nr:aspartate--tRNA ligase [Candidatus Woesearchaeota archaeon]